jgi:hypothetical protein
MVNLEVALLQLGQANLTTGTLFPCQAVLKFLTKGASATKETTTDFGKVSETVCPDAPAICSPSDPEGFKWNAAFSYVPSRTRRVVVSILGSQFLSRNESVLEDVLDYPFRTQGCDCPNPIKELFGYLSFRHFAPTD